MSFKVKCTYGGKTQEITCKNRLGVHDMNSIVYNTAKSIFPNGEYMPGLKEFILRHFIVRFITGIDLLPVDRELKDGEFATVYDFLIFSDLYDNIIPTDEDLECWHEDRTIPENRLHPGQYLSILNAVDEQIEARLRQSKWDDVAEKLLGVVNKFEESLGGIDLKEVVDTFSKLANMTSDDIIDAALKQQEQN